jgi:4-amino-4-deoxy-L-arabinose transferase-like glycosyltransferase
MLTPARREVALVALLTAVAALPRLVNLLGQAPFVDEAAFLRWAVLQFKPDDPATLWLPLSDEGRPPLFFWLEVVAAHVVNNGFLAGRLVATISGIASVLAVYGLGRALLSREAALLAALGWALSPLAVFFTRIAVDDSILTLGAVLAALASVRLVRGPTLMTGSAVGLSIGLAILTKPLALLIVPLPLLAWVTLSHRRPSARLIAAGCAAAITAMILVFPLVSWIPQMQTNANAFADMSLIASAGDPASAMSRLLRIDLLSKNLPTAVGWLDGYAGSAVLGLAAAGGLLGVARRSGPLLYLVCVWAVPFVVLMDRTTLLYSRYLFFFAFPLFCLAAAAMVWFVDTALGTVAQVWPAVQDSRWRLCTLGAAALAAGATVLPVTYDVVMAPERAALPRVDRVQYFDQWAAFFGLGRVAAYVAETSRDSPATVLIPTNTYPQQRVADALQEYMRGEASVQFVRDRSLDEGWSLCALRPWLSSSTPVFLVIDGVHDGAGDPPIIPAYTRTLEAALARDLPEVEPVLSIPRPEGNARMALYRLDGAVAAAAASGPACTAPQRSFGAGWHEADKLLGGTEPARWTSATAEYSEGPLPAGWYRPLLYAQSLGAVQSITLRLNGVVLGDQPPPGESGWHWIEGDAPVWVPEGETAHLEVAVQASSGPSPRLTVSRLLLQREAGASASRRTAPFFIADRWVRSG